MGRFKPKKHVFPEEKPEPGGGTKLYFVGSAQWGVVKIGISSNPKARRKELQRHNPFKLTEFAVIQFLPSPSGGCTAKQARRLERTVHRFLGPERLRGEWFRLSRAVRLLIVAARDGEERLRETMHSMNEQPAVMENLAKHLFRRDIKVGVIGGKTHLPPV